MVELGNGGALERESQAPLFIAIGLEIARLCNSLGHSRLQLVRGEIHKVPGCGCAKRTGKSRMSLAVFIQYRMQAGIQAIIVVCFYMNSCPFGLAAR